MVYTVGQFLTNTQYRAKLMQTVVRNVIRTGGEAIFRLARLEGKTAQERVELTLQYTDRILKRAKVDVRLTHQDIASLSGLSRETVTTALGRMESQ
jgi:CRP-like cAMP-binding protein